MILYTIGLLLTLIGLTPASAELIHLSDLTLTGTFSLAHYPTDPRGEIEGTFGPLTVTSATGMFEGVEIGTTLAPGVFETPSTWQLGPISFTILDSHFSGNSNSQLSGQLLWSGNLIGLDDPLHPESHWFWSVELPRYTFFSDFPVMGPIEVHLEQIWDNGVVPEPGTLLLVALGLCATLWRWRVH